MIHYLTGDATHPATPGLKIIAHVCNDAGAWGAGFVMAVSRRWSLPARRYRAWRGRGLGQVQFVVVEPDVAVANMVAQRGVGSQGGVPPIRYVALGTCLATVADYARRHGASVHTPRIGCGLAGGTWPLVGPIIEEKMGGVEVYVYTLEGRG